MSAKLLSLINWGVDVSQYDGHDDTIEVVRESWLKTNAEAVKSELNHKFEAL